MLCSALSLCDLMVLQHKTEVQYIIWNPESYSDKLFEKKILFNALLFRYKCICGVLSKVPYSIFFFVQNTIQHLLYFQLTNEVNEVSIS